MKRWICLLLLLLILPLTAAPSVKVEQGLNLTEDPLPFGKPAELVITLSWSGEEELKLPEAETLAIPKAHMIDRYRVDRGSDGVNRVVDYHLIFTYFEPGEFEVGPVKIPLSSENSVSTEPLSMTFAGSQKKEGDKEGEIRENKPVFELSTLDWWKQLAVYLLTILAVLALLGGLIQQLGILDRFRSPKGRALKSLARLKKRDLPPEVFLLELVAILRDYLAQAYGLKAWESTSSELSKQMTMDNRCRKVKSTAEQVLQEGDAVKFAGAEVSSGQVDDLHQKLVTTLKEEEKTA